jgi:hypothetical protein
MRRRALLASCGLVGLSGCLGYRVVDAEATADRRVRVAELESQVAAREERIAELEATVDSLRRRLAGPRINAVSPVDGWERTGDVVVRGVDRVAAGDPLVVAVSFTQPIRGGGETGRVDVSLAVSVTDAAGERVARGERDVELVLDTDATLAELPVRFDDADLDPGEYAATARVTDEITRIETTADPVAFRVE